MEPWAQWLVGVAVTAAVLYVALLVALLVLRPRGMSPGEVLAVGRDVARLATRLARDARVPRGSRVALWLLVAYLAMPFDLVPDMLPVIGQLDDVVVVALALRYAARQVPRDVLLEAWPGDRRIIERLLGTPRTTPVPTDRER